MQECLMHLKLSQYSQNFQSNGIHLLDELLETNIDHKTLKKIGISNEKHRKQLMKYVSLVKQQTEFKSAAQVNTTTNSSYLKQNPAVSVL